jgi:hypothetical protein
VAFFADFNTVFSVINAIGVVAGILFAGCSLRADSKMRRISNLVSLTENHRELWTLVLDRPDLKRVLKDDLDLNGAPVTEEEQIFTTLIILHIQIVYQATRENVLSFESEGLEGDLKILLNRPITKNVWSRIRSFQNRDFIQFIDRMIQSKES